MNRPWIHTLSLVTFAYALASPQIATAAPAGPLESAPIHHVSGADRVLRIGFQGSWGEHTEVGIGARVIVSVPLVVTGFDIIGSFDWFFSHESRSVGDNFDFDYWEANLNAVKALIDVGVARPYIGAGLNIAHRDQSDSDYGMNLVGGIELDAGIHPFAELRYELGGGEQWVLTGGLIF